MNFSRFSVQYLFLTIFGLLAMFFAFPDVSEAECQVSINDFNFRNGGDKGQNWFDQENKPIIYVDFKTTGCVDGVLYLTIFGFGTMGTALGDVPVISDEAFSTFAIQVPQLEAQGGDASMAFYPGENTCYGWNDDTTVGNNGRECIVFAMITNLPPTNPSASILGLEGNLASRIKYEDAEFFSSIFANGIDPSNDCEVVNQYFYVIAQECIVLIGTPLFGIGNTFAEKLVAYYNATTNFSGNNALALADTDTTEGNDQGASLAFPALTYNCDGACQSSVQWEQVPNGFLEFGETSLQDTTPVVPSPLSEIYQENYYPLAPLPFEGLSGGPTPDLGTFLASIFRAVIVIIIILAVLMIVFHGIAYATTGAIQKKDDHREGVWNAILGLLIALGSWLLLNTISPRLASELSIGIPEVSLDGYEYSGPGVASIPTDGSCGPQQTPACPSCQPIEGGIQLKPEVAVPGHNTISQSTLQKLYNMQNTLNANGISWRVTEAFSPTYMQHCSQCHYNGSCIDANFDSTNPTPQNIEAFVQAAAAAGLRAVYETNSQSTINQIQAETDLQPSTKGGTGNYLLLNGITAPHFSVYNK